MAFNFLGTMTLGQLTELRNFLMAEISNIEDEVNTLTIQQKNMERVRGSLIEADQKFKGNAVNSISANQLLKINSTGMQDDTVSALLVDKLKKPWISTIKYKRERLEYKILKVLDVIEQLNEARDRKAIAKSQTVELLNKVQVLFNKKNKVTLSPSTETV
jgi:hypothetical protein